MKTYVLRTCGPDLRSHGGFQWPESGLVSAPDWRVSPECGHGLHGLATGEGNGSLLGWNAEARWLMAILIVALAVVIAAKAVVLAWVTRRRSQLAVETRMRAAGIIQ